jgi:phosphoglucosamine mutase
VDCANGATYSLAPKLFSELGADVQALFTEPDGKNINDGCGSQHPQELAEKVKEIGAHIGLAFDGDGDRLVAVDETGAILTGDQVLAICASYLKENGRLKNNTVVSTVMSNMGLGEALKKMDIENAITGVGDRYVMEEMRQRGAVLGGEESGHTVFLDHQTTGDGLLTALKLLEIMQIENKPLSELKSIMTVFPQVLINVDVKSKPPLESLPDIMAVIKNVEKDLDGKGRVLVRYSGTQPQCRVMVESLNTEDTRFFCDKIARVIKEIIGS